MFHSVPILVMVLNVLLHHSVIMPPAKRCIIKFWLESTLGSLYDVFVLHQITELELFAHRVRTQNLNYLYTRIDQKVRN